MLFNLTTAHINSLLDPASAGNWEPFLAANDPDMKWLIADPAQNSNINSGIYNVQTWLSQVSAPLRSRLKDGVLKMTTNGVDVVGLKSFVEASGETTQNNGQQYNNRYCWILIFDGETGKVVEIREYLNTALVKEVMEGNRAGGGDGGP